MKKMIKERKYFFCRNCGFRYNIHNICYSYETKQELCNDCFRGVWNKEYD